MTTTDIDTRRQPAATRTGDPKPFFRLLERRAPGLGARLAERIWFTLPRPRPGPVAAPGGRRFSVTVDAGTVTGATWGVGPAVYLIHGWGGSRRQFGAFVAPLVEAGYRVVAFDAPSHGESSPGRHGRRSSTALEFTAALQAVSEAHGPAHAVIAHSLGGLATAVALRDGWTVRRVVLLAPVASMLGFVSRLREALGFGDRTARRLLMRAHRRVGVSMDEFEATSMLSGRTVPATLVIHDRDDGMVPHADGAAIAAAWPGARLHLTTGLGHHRLLRDVTVADEVVRFVTA